MPIAVAQPEAAWGLSERAEGLDSATSIARPMPNMAAIRHTMVKRLASIAPSFIFGLDDASGRLNPA